MPGFTPKEIDLIESISKRYQADLDYSKIAQLVHTPGFTYWSLQVELVKNPSRWKSLPPEVWAAAAVDGYRSAEEMAESGELEKDLFITSYVAMTGHVIATGLQIIKSLDEFWRFEPTIEIIFDLNEEQLEKAHAYVKAFEGTDHDHALNTNQETLIHLYQQWDVKDLSTENINRGREIYEEIIKICERGFPNLLALKRILDGETPDVESLQRERASSVRDELLDDAPLSNSDYFKLIVREFDKPLRNGVAHNDIVTDPAEREVRIPTTNTRYSFEEFNGIVKANLANGMFLTDAYRSLIEWHTITAGDKHRPERPEWIFGDESLPKEFAASHDHEEAD